jgi:hypothetical protein
MFAKSRFMIPVLILVLTTLACNIAMQGGNSQPTQPAQPTPDTTRIVLEAQATALAAALAQQPTNAPTVAASATAPATETTAPSAPPTETSIPEPTTADMDALIQNANILVYEDAGSVYLDTWVKSSLDLMGLKYTHVGDALGNFMTNLNSSTKWDLIIVAAESRRGVQGEFWDIILPKVNNEKTALIAEMWYLSNIANGRIKSLTDACGIAFQSTRGLVESIYLLDSSSPIFSTPNGGFSLTNYVGYWKDKGGDYVRATSSDAVLLAGGFASEKSRYGMITSCFEGRAIIQTFSSHDYKRADMVKLWQNYITNTLTNHFQALP